MPDTPLRILYYWPAPRGGIADYCLRQSQALLENGIDLHILCSPEFSYIDKLRPYCVPALTDPIGWKNRRLRQAAYIYSLINNASVAHRYCSSTYFDLFLFATFPGLLTPFWRHKISRLKRKGTRIASMLHDPSLDYIVGTEWLHNWSVSSASSLLDIVFSHSEVNLPHFSGTSIVLPHGPYTLGLNADTPVDLRESLQIHENDTVLLLFGHIRDNKNLACVIEALGILKKRGCSRYTLVVAGDVPSGQSRTIQDYRHLAKVHHVEDQIRWVTDFIPNDLVGCLFEMCDAVLLTYSSSFRSASGVLNLTSAFRKPCVVSGGPGPLRDLAIKYKLGPVIEPDDSDEIYRGIKSLVAYPDCVIRWSDYERDNSWGENARLVSAAACLPIP